MPVFTSLPASLASLRSPIPSAQDEPGLWRPTVRTHLLHLGVAVFLIVLSPYLGTPREATVLVLTAAASLALPLTSVLSGLGAVVSLVTTWISSAVPQTTGLIASMVIWGVVAMLLARGFPRLLVYGYVAAALLVIVYYGNRQGLFGASLVWIAIIAVPCITFGEALRYQRKRAIDASLRRREVLARQRRLVVSELHDTVASDLVYAVMTAEQLKMSRPDDRELSRELDAVIEPVRTAVAQLRRSLQSMTVADDDDVPLSALASPRPIKQVLADVRRVLEERGASLEVEAVELLESEDVFTPGVRQQVLRVVNELVNNVAKYTSAGGSARIVVGVNDDVVECMVTNSADANRTRDVTYSSGIGLEGARSRVETLGGDFVTYRSGTRWTVTFSVPLRRI